MKVIFVNRYFYPDHSATSQLLTDLAFYLADRSGKVEVITSRQRYDMPEHGLPGHEFIKNVEIRRIWSTRFGRNTLSGRALDYVSFYGSALVRLLLDTRRGDILVAETDPPLISVIVAFVAWVRHARLINWVQDLFPEVATALNVTGMGGRFAQFVKRLRNWSLRRADINIVLGECMKKRLVAELGGSENIEIIHNWSDGSKIKPVPREVNPLIKEWGLLDKFVIGYSGNMGRAHEFRTILDAAESLREHTCIVFLFIGGGAQCEWIGREAKSRGLVNIMIKPYQPRKNLANSLGVADVHLITLNPALEGLIVPSKFYGIAAAGRASIFVGSRDGEIAMILEQGNCGFVVGNGDRDSLVDHILELSGDREYSNKLGESARKTFEKEYESASALVLWEQVLEKIQ